MNSSSIITIDTIPFHADIDKLAVELKLNKKPKFMAELRKNVKDAEAVARPKGIYRRATVKPKDDVTIIIGGVEFKSRVLRVNLEGMKFAYPFIATGGREVEEWTLNNDDPLSRWWRDAISEMALGAAMDALCARIDAEHGREPRAMMNPGSLSDWPLTEQQPFFTLFGKATEGIGVTLSSSNLMSPKKSVSGLWFHNEEGFESCMLCPNDDCPSRRAPYNSELFDKKYRI